MIGIYRLDNPNVAQLITPDDNSDVPDKFNKAFFVNDASPGNVALGMWDGSSVIITPTTRVMVNIHFKRILATGTTVSSIFGFGHI